MGRKPVLTVAGTLLMSLALAGCQTSSNSRPNTQFTPASASTASQNKGVNSPSGPAMTTNNGLPNGGPSQSTLTNQPNSPLGQSSMASQPNSPLGQSSMTSQPGYQVGLPNQTGSQGSPTSSGITIPPKPTPVVSQQQTPQGLQPSLPSGSSSFSSSTGGSSLSPLPAATSNLMPISSQAPSLPPPPIGAIAQPAPIAFTGGPSSSGAIDLLNPLPSGPANMSRINVSQPAPIPTSTSGFATQQGPLLPN